MLAFADGFLGLRRGHARRPDSSDERELQRGVEGVDAEGQPEEIDLEPLDAARGDPGQPEERELESLAARRGDATMAEMALSQINTAFETLRDGGDAARSETYGRLLPRARAIVSQLRGQ